LFDPDARPPAGYARNSAATVWKTASMRFQAGQAVRVEFTKWDGREHWVYDGVYLGEDEHGEWIGHPAGTLMSRPGRSFTDTTDWLTLVPSDHRPWLATYNTLQHHLRIYIDLTTPAVWDGATLHTVDMDLDVVVRRDGQAPYIDDQDEFAEHQLTFGYPAEVVALTERTAHQLLTAVNAGDPPFDATADHWLAELGHSDTTV
jgi:protein associated with RNAse G/E